VVERIPCCAWTSNSLALTMFMVPDYWLIENQSEFTNKSRNAMVPTYDLVIYSEVIRRDLRLCLLFIYILFTNKITYNIQNKVQGVGSNLFLKYTTRTHSLSKKNQHTKHYA